MLAPNSLDNTWDAIGDSFGPDVKFLNRALELVFEKLPIDATRVVMGGFSDGASYAISLGLLNGDLFKGVMAFSPGFVIEGPWVGNRDFTSLMESTTASCQSQNVGVELPPT